MEDKIIYIDESNLSNNLDLLEEQFEVKKEGSQLFIEGNGIVGNCFIYDILDEVSLSVNNVSFKDNVVLSNVRKDDGVIVIMLLFSSDWEINNNEVGKGSENGVVMFRSSSEVSKTIKANTNHKWITIRMSSSFYLNLSGGDNKIIKDFIFNEHSWVLFESVTPEIHQCLNELFSYDDIHIPGVRISCISIAFKLLGILGEIIYRRVKDKRNYGSLDTDSLILFKIKDDILADITATPNINELASRYAISTSKLRSNFKKMFGMPVMKFLMNERFYEAYRRIQESQDPIKSIAYDTGFANVTHFSKGFKDLFGFAPSQLRK